MSPTPIKMNARGNPQKKEGKMRIRAFPVSKNSKNKTTNANEFAGYEKHELAEKAKRISAIR